VGSAAAFAGGPALATQAYDALAERRGRIIVASMVGSTVFDLFDRVLLLLAAATGRWDAIDEHAERALAIAAKLGSPVWTARVQADWADALEQRARGGDVEKARVLRQTALGTAERLGMPGLSARCRALPKAQGVPARPVTRDHREGPSIELARTGELWTVRGFGEEVHVKDSRGMQMIARLVEEPGSELHVLDLAGGTGADGGDAGPVLDAKAREQYRARLVEIAALREEAESLGDRGRAERANAEIEALTGELERALGLGGRERRVGAASERARSNVQRRIAHALEQIRAASPRLGEHLAATIRTGTYCAYELG